MVWGQKSVKDEACPIRPSLHGVGCGQVTGCVDVALKDGHGTMAHGRRINNVA